MASHIGLSSGQEAGAVPSTQVPLVQQAVVSPLAAARPLVQPRQLGGPGGDAAHAPAYASKVGAKGSMLLRITHVHARPYDESPHFISYMSAPITAPMIVGPFSLPMRPPAQDPVELLRGTGAVAKAAGSGAIPARLAAMSAMRADAEARVNRAGGPKGSSTSP